MLPSDLFGKGMSPPFVLLPSEHDTLPCVDLGHGALTPHKRSNTMTEPNANVPLAKRLQLISELEDDKDAAHFGNKNTQRASEGSQEAGDTGHEATDAGNIAGTPAFITSLMKIIKFSDEQRQGESKSTNLSPSHFNTRTDKLTKTYTVPSVQKLLHPYDIDNNSVKLSTTRGNPLLNLSHHHYSESHMQRYIPSQSELMDHSSDTDDAVFAADDDEVLLNTLPTSVDDLREMEQRLERHYSSPMMSHGQSPNAMDAGRISITSGASFAFDGAFSASSNREGEQFDADDMEVAMINESFEEQQRQYKLYCGDDLKAAFYSAAFFEAPLTHSDAERLVDAESIYPIPVTVPEDEPSYNNDTGYYHSVSMQSSFDMITQPIIDDLFTSVIPRLDDSDTSIFPMPSLQASVADSLESMRVQDPVFPNVPASPQGTRCETDRSAEDEAIATVLSSANFVLDNIDSPQKPEAVFSDDASDEPLMMRTHSRVSETSEEEELIWAWEEIKNSNNIGENIRYVSPCYHVSPPSVHLDKIDEPPKNIKALGHVTEVFKMNGELDTEPVLQYYQSIGMKNFYQRDIDIQRAFLVFATVNEAKYAVENNKTGVQIRLLEESPQFVKLKALKMHLELRPCCYDDVEPTPPENLPMSWQSLSEPIAGV